MSILNAISTLKKIAPLSEEQAQAFLDTLPLKTQNQIIAAIYIGRDHIHETTLRDDSEISCLMTDHIPQKDYARIIYEKSSNVKAYLEKLELCAKNSGFDLNNL